MRILLVSHGYPPHGIAGVERVAHQSAVSLVQRGHSVTVLTRRPSPAPPTLALERDVVDGVDVVRIAGGGSTFGVYPGVEEGLESVFARMLAEVLPDAVVFAHLLHQSAGDVAIAQRWGVPAVVELHDFYAACPLAHLQRVSGERCLGPEGGLACATHCFPGQEEPAARWGLRAQEFRGAVHDADVVLAPSEFVASYFAGMREGASPIRVVGNGIGVPPSPARLDHGSGSTLHLASIGVVIAHKGAHVVVDALRRARIGRVRYTLFGKVVPEYAAQLREAAETVPGLELRIFGTFQPSDLPALLGEVDVVLVPSVVWETYSIAAREALACGVPVLASRLGALPEAVRDGENGLLYRAEDPGHLAELLRALDADRGRIAALARGIRPSDWMTVDERADALEQILGEAVATGVSQARPATEFSALRRALAGR